MTFKVKGGQEPYEDLSSQWNDGSIEGKAQQSKPNVVREMPPVPANQHSPNGSQRTDDHVYKDGTRPLDKSSGSAPPFVSSDSP